MTRQQLDADVAAKKAIKLTPAKLASLQASQTTHANLKGCRLVFAPPHDGTAYVYPAGGIDIRVFKLAIP